MTQTPTMSMCGGLALRGNKHLCGITLSPCATYLTVSRDPTGWQLIVLIGDTLLAHNALGPK